jgi:hypothetical protein
MKKLPMSMVAAETGHIIVENAKLVLKSAG